MTDPRLKLAVVTMQIAASAVDGLSRESLMTALMTSRMIVAVRQGSAAVRRPIPVTFDLFSYHH